MLSGAWAKPSRLIVKHYGTLCQSPQETSFEDLSSHDTIKTTMKKKNSRASRLKKKATSLRSAKHAFGGVKEISLDRIVVRAKAQAVGPE
jgi:hypothetical protein